MSVLEQRMNKTGTHLKYHISLILVNLMYPMEPCSSGCWKPDFPGVSCQATNHTFYSPFHFYSRGT